MPLTLSGDGQISTLVGQVAFFAMQTAPAGFLACSGQAVSRTTYASLFSALGTLYGAGDGSTTFNLPDLRGEFIRGWDNGRGVDTGRVFGSAQADDFKSHTHVDNVSSTEGPGGAPGAGVALFSTGAATSATGGTETRPRNVALLACIKF